MENLSVWAHSPTTRKVLLRDVCATLPEGSLFAILGGSGKTTLLNVIAGSHDRRRQNLTGSVRYCPGTAEIGYVSQEDRLSPFQTRCSQPC